MWPNTNIQTWCKKKEEVIDRKTDPINKPLLAELFHRCWLAMPLGADILCWVLACRTLEKTKQNYLFGYI